MGEVKLYIGGMIWSGWTETTVTKSLDAMFGEGRLSLTRKFGDSDATVPSVRVGQTARITLDGETLISGFIHSRALEVDDDAFDLDITVRDKTALLSKGCILNDPAEWKNQTALQIITEICKPFGISVSAEMPVGKAFAKFTAQPGDTAQKVIEKICRHRALICYASATGNLILTTAKAAATTSDEIRLHPSKGNALALSLSESLEDRHNLYVCRTQDRGSDWGSSEHSKVEGRAKDHGMPLYCPLVIIADEPGGTAAMTELATTTASINAARAESREYVVAGWRGSSGRFWDINKKVSLTDQIEGFSGQRLISKAVFTVTSSVAEETRLTLTSPAAYELVAEPDEKPGEVWS